jgi:hypothetical protein
MFKDTITFVEKFLLFIGCFWFVCVFFGDLLFCWLHAGLFVATIMVTRRRLSIGATVLLGVVIFYQVIVRYPGLSSQLPLEWTNRLLFMSIASFAGFFVGHLIRKRPRVRYLWPKLKFLDDAK